MFHYNVYVEISITKVEQFFLQMVQVRNLSLDLDKLKINNHRQYCNGVNILWIVTSNVLLYPIRGPELANTFTNQAYWHLNMFFYAFLYMIYSTYPYSKSSTYEKFVCYLTIVARDKDYNFVTVPQTYVST